MSDFFNDKSIKDIQNWIYTNKVLFVTNSKCLPGTLFMASLKTYMQYLPIHNFTIFPGIKNDVDYFGRRVYCDLLRSFYKDKNYKHYDYMVYIDDDCFINDFKKMMNELYEFVTEDKWCIAGPQDGGVLCHRNHSDIMINTFLSFWNIKNIRNKMKFEDLENYINRHFFHNIEVSYTTFLNYMKEKPELLKTMQDNADEMKEVNRQYRMANFDDKGECPYCSTVRKDVHNISEVEQTPYSINIVPRNYEPYYIVEQALVYFTGMPIKYFFAVDLHHKDFNDDEIDNSGLSSCIMDKQDKGVIAVHMWYSREYTKYPTTELQLIQTKRINKTLRYFHFV